MAEGLDLRPLEAPDEDRLPWLETVEPDEPPRRAWGRIVAFLLVAVIAIGAIAFGVDRYRHRDAGGNGELIAAEQTPYKVKPDSPGGLKVSGEGNAAIATSAGKGAGNAAIDLQAVPETPVTSGRARPVATEPDGGRNAVAEVPDTGGKLVAAPPVTVARPAAATGGGGSQVQLGAFPSEAAANAAWTGFSKRFAYVAALGKSVQPVAIGGHTLYRLRIEAGSANQAADICGRLKVAGEACFVAG